MKVICQVAAVTILVAGCGLDDGNYKKQGFGNSSMAITNAEGEREVPYKDSDWLTHYVDLANHFLRGAPLPVSGEDGRRVIAVLETAEKSSKSGHSEPVPFP